MDGIANVMQWGDWWWL